MFATNLLAALQSLCEQWRRAVLSALGVMVASVAIILLVSIAKGVQKDVGDQVRSLGVNVVVVLPARVDLNSLSFNPNLGGQSFLKEEHAAALRGIPGVVRTCPLSFAGGGARHGDKEAYPITIATTSDWFAMRPLKMRSGSTFDDPQEASPVCVIGSIAAEALFGTEDPLGKEIEVNRRKYRVIGVTEDKKSEQSLFSMGSFENVVYLPYHAVKREGAPMQIDRIMVQSAAEAEPKALVKELDAALASRLDRQQFSVATQEDLLSLVYKLMSILTYLLAGLTSIALFVGGVGIMTVMLMSVGERAQEIGIRKTTGARRRDIFQQFLAEAVALALVGGIAGLAFSSVVCWLLAAYTPIKPMLSGDVVALAFGTSLLVGTVFGLVPAVRAARKDPVQALRSE